MEPEMIPVRLWPKPRIKPHVCVFRFRYLTRGIDWVRCAHTRVGWLRIPVA